MLQAGAGSDQRLRPLGCILIETVAQRPVEDCAGMREDTLQKTCSACRLGRVRLSVGEQELGAAVRVLLCRRRLWKDYIAICQENGTAVKGKRPVSLLNLVKAWGS